jgi:hypothetical protein
MDPMSLSEIRTLIESTARKLGVSDQEKIDEAIHAIVNQIIEHDYLVDD